MGYLFLTIALLSGTAKGFCGKKVSGFVSDFRGAMFSNFLRMLFCIPIGFVFVLIGGELSDFSLSGMQMLSVILSAVSTSSFVVFWLLSVRRGAYMLVDVFLTVGIIIPILLSRILFDEEIRTNHIIGLVILFIAVIIMCTYNTKINARPSALSWLILILTGISSGVMDFSQKAFAKISDGGASVFNLYTYVLSAIILLILFFILTVSSKKTRAPIFEEGAFKRIILYIVIMAICLFLNSYFKTLAATRLTSAALYPLNQGAALILSTLMSGFIFREKITPRCIVGITSAFIGLLIINLL